MIEQHHDQHEVAFFIDPPCTASTKKAGRRLYTHHEIDHQRLFHLTADVSGDFLMTYDDAQEVRLLAEQHQMATRLVSMTNTHHATLYELLIGRDLNWV
ncbi:MAG: hypothetical protein ABTQ73_10435 [Caldilineales bacterium]